MHSPTHASIRTRRSLLLAISSLPVALYGCGGSGGEGVPFQVTAYGAWYPEGNSVYRSRSALEQAQLAAWNNTPSFAYPVEAPPSSMPIYPAVDFSSQVVVAVSAGMLNTCQQLLIESVERTGSGLVVKYRRDPPGAPPTSVCTALNKHAAVFATVSATDAEIRFVRTDA
jgi:hypothetical protein